LGTSRQDAGSKCISFGGGQIDQAVAEEVLAVVQRPAVQAALEAADAEVSKQGEVIRLLELELEQANYRARLAEQRYDAVDPNNRLVAPQLEHRWNEALAEVERVRLRLDERRERQAPAPTQQQLGRIAEQLSSVWADERTDTRLKQRIVAILIDEIIVDIDEEQGTVSMLIRWHGGRHSETTASRRRANKRTLKTKVPTLEIVKGLGPYFSDRHIVAVLNRLGLKTLRGRTWTAAGLQGFRHAHGLTDEVFARLRDDNPTVTLMEAAKRLNVATSNVRRLIARGLLPAEQVAPCAPWRVSETALSDPAVHAAAAEIRNRGNYHRRNEKQQSLFNSSH